MPNRLAASTSPYLLQHANNPVDWFPWGEEALAKARREGKPIFLSIGYSACHWCHVMERESFENPRIAAYLNEHFVSIKVDREERPDLDEIYMACVQLLTGSGGWPMSVFLTSDGRPFYGGTYYPPEDRWGRPGFMSLVVSLREAFVKEQDKVAGNAEAIVRAIAGISEGYDQDDEALAKAEPFRIDKHGARAVEEAVRGLAARFDPHWAGFGPAPKFPPSMGLALLLRQRARTGEAPLLEMAEATLDRMARGGICDQLAGGFHRYSTDERWLAPHFEKMLYDNALLAPVYFDAWRATGDGFYRTVGRETLDWMLAEMTDAEGGFHSALDADSEGVEGKFYLWTPEEVASVLGPEEAAIFCDFYDVRKGGNWHEGGGASILNVPKPLAPFAAALGESPGALRARLDAMRSKLLAERRRRIAPLKDDKVLAGWNGLAISALAQGTQATGDPRYAEAAARAARFVLSRMCVRGALNRAWRAGKGHIPAFLEDYAPVVNGLIDLYETLFDEAWIDEAAILAEGMIRRFADGGGAICHSTDGLDGSVIVRMKDTMDGATPSGAASAVHALRRLGILLDRDDFREAARKTIESVGGDLRARAQGHHHLLCALSDEIDPPVEIAIAGKRGDAATEELIQAAWESYLPGRVLAFAPAGEGAPKAPDRRIAPLRGKSAPDGKPAAWVCRGGICMPPARGAAEFQERLSPAGKP